MLDYLGPAAETGLVSVGRIRLFGSGRVDRQRGVYWACWTIWVRPRRQRGCPSGVLDYLGLALLTGKGCLLSVLDYLGPAAETSLVSVGRIGLFGSGRVDRQRGVYWACWTIWVRPRR